MKRISDLEIKDVASVLASLASVIEKWPDASRLYLRKKEQHLVPDSIETEYSQLPAFLNRIGIRSLMLRPGNHKELLLASAFEYLASKHDTNFAVALNSEPVRVALGNLFEQCQSIAFNEWSAVKGASSIWSALLQNIISPIKKSKPEYIFYLGNPARSRFVELEEIIDIIGEFSKFGKVTFILDQSEAIRLWMVLNGELAISRHPQQAVMEMRKKYYSIYRTMNVERLVIYSASDVFLFSTQESFVMARKSPDQALEQANEARDNFITGFSVGLLLDLDPAGCIATGLLAFGTQGISHLKADKSSMVAYLNSWIQELADQHNM